MKVNIDLNLCQSNGECVAVAPDIFQLDENDYIVWKEEVDESRRADMEAAVNACPTTAISLEG